MSLPLPPVRVNKFYARFPGECAECLLPIEVNDIAGFVADSVCCETCCAEWEAMCSE